MCGEIYPLPYLIHFVKASFIVAVATLAAVSPTASPPSLSRYHLLSGPAHRHSHTPGSYADVSRALPRPADVSSARAAPGGALQRALLAAFAAAARSRLVIFLASRMRHDT